MKTWNLLASLLIVVLISSGCAKSDSQESNTLRPVALETPASIPDEFGDYWYQGEAEITSYNLTQARYGELRDGHAVLIFVTEDFSRAENVKLNNPSTAGKDAVKVLKLNLTKKFLTGIYPYSLMSSVFTPVYNSEPTLKVTTSSQEWCGHSFSMMAKNEDGYSVDIFSYFEDESASFTLQDVLLEDEIWNTIRLDPSRLATGDFQMVPGQIFQRLGHVGAQPARATGLLSESNEGIRSYLLEYPDHKRSLTIRFSDSFPYTIEGWEETHRSGFGPNAKELTTSATLNKRIMTDYWSKNGTDDEVWREELGL